MISHSFYIFYFMDKENWKSMQKDLIQSHSCKWKYTMVSVAVSYFIAWPVKL